MEEDEDGGVKIRHLPPQTEVENKLLLSASQFDLHLTVVSSANSSDILSCTSNENLLFKVKEEVESEESLLLLPENNSTDSLNISSNKNLLPEIKNESLPLLTESVDDCDNVTVLKLLNIKYNLPSSTVSPVNSSDTPKLRINEEFPVKEEYEASLLSESVNFCNTAAVLPKEVKSVGLQVNAAEDLNQFRDAQVQVNTSAKVTVTEFVHTDDQLKSLTGLETFALLDDLVDELKLKVKDKRLHRLTLFQRVFMTLMKMKLNLPYVVLAVLFGVSGQTCKDVFTNIASILPPILKKKYSFSSV